MRFWSIIMGVMRVRSGILYLIALAAALYGGGPEVGAAIGWGPTAEITDSTGGSPAFVESGEFFDLFTPHFDLMWDFGAVSLGGRAGLLYASDIFGDSQRTRLTAWSARGVFVYNYEMNEAGDWLFPISLSLGHLWRRVDYEAGTGDYRISGEGACGGFAFGVEHFAESGYSLGFSIGRDFRADHLDGSEYGIEPAISLSGWRFKLFGRFSRFRRKE